MASSEPSEKRSQDELEDAAREYAWQWFIYHANQRQIVFRFFLIIVGGTVGVYATLTKELNYPDWIYWLGLAIFLFALFFWRLDERSRDLINPSEAYLKNQERNLSQALGDSSIEIANASHDIRISRIAFSFKLYTFKQIYRLIFLFIAAVGLAIFMFDSKSPLRCIFESFLNRPCT